jgi:hypothetical protein
VVAHRSVPGYAPPMFAFALPGGGIDLVPNDDDRTWLMKSLVEVVGHLGPHATSTRLLAPPSRKVQDFDALFAMICEVQANVGQHEVEFELVDGDGPLPPLAAPLVAIGEAKGHLMHTMRAGEELVLVASRTVFKVQNLLAAHVAREVGRMALVQAGAFIDTPPGPRGVVRDEPEAASELAAISLGLGPWILNGSAIFENACCGGGCGVNLRSIRAGLSMPEAAYAVALDAHRRRLSGWSLSRMLESNQRAAFKQSTRAVSRGGAAVAALEASTTAALPGRLG